MKHVYSILEMGNTLGVLARNERTKQLIRLQIIISFNPPASIDVLYMLFSFNENSYAFHLKHNIVPFFNITFLFTLWTRDIGQIL